MDKHIDTRILVLYKQHYREHYDKQIQSQFYCFGYYDGISVCKLNEKQNNSTVEIADDSLISSLWYGAQRASAELNGNFSSQIVGIFREKTESEPDESVNYKEWPYLSVCFLQLEFVKEVLKEKEIKKDIESEFSCLKDDKCVNIKAYLTFDNASLVCIGYSNSMTLLCEKIREIEKYKGVVYSYSIFGINNDFLNSCNNQLRDKFNKRNVHLNDEIYDLTLRVSHGGGVDIVNRIKKYLCDTCNMTGFDIVGLNDATYYYKQGHANSIIVFPKTTVKSLIVLIANKGLITLQNEIYNKDIYNIESSFSSNPGERIMDGVSGNESSDDDNINKSVISSWSEKEIEKYQKYAEAELQSKNDAMYSVYMGIIRSLNSIAQYENYNIGRELFDILNPAFKLFDKLVDDAISYRKTDPSRYIDIQGCIKTEANIFTAAVNDVLYHTVHSDQMYFMLPGFSGVSFAISQKLLIFYNWYCSSLIKILNDDHHNEYQVLISPVMESAAKVSYLDFGTDLRDRVLILQISQRAMSFPRHNMIVLCHEVGHFVGDCMRLRKRRVLSICETLGTLIAEVSWAKRSEEPEYSKKVNEAFDYMITRLIDVTAYRCSQRLADALVKNRPDSKYYYSDIQNDLVLNVRKIVLEDKEKIWREAVPNVIDLVGSLNETETVDLLYRYRKLIKDERINSIDIVSSGILDSFVNLIMVMFREVYADVTAITLLECEYDDYKESFSVAEGLSYPEEMDDDTIKMRLSIAKALYQMEDQSIQEEGISNSKRLMATDFQTKLYRMSWFRQKLIEYAMHCQKALKSEIKNHENDTKAIRKMYKIIKESSKDSGISIYDEIITENNRFIEDCK